MIADIKNKLYLYLYEAGLGRTKEMSRITLELQDELSSKSKVDGSILFIACEKTRAEIMNYMNDATSNDMLRRASNDLTLHSAKVDVMVVPVILSDIDIEYIIKVVKSSVNTNILGIVIDGLDNLHGIPTNANYIENLKIIVHELNKFIDKYQIPLLVSRQIPFGGINVTKIHKDDAVIEMHCTMNLN